MQHQALGERASPFGGREGGIGRAVLEYNELLAGKRADNVYQASFSRSECVVQKREMSMGDGWRLIGVGSQSILPSLDIFLSV